MSATGYRQRPLAWLLRGLARLVARCGSPERPSRLLARLIFGSFNLGFLPARTSMDWLSRDPAEVDKYLADPLCGFDPCPGLWIDLFGGIIAMERGEASGDSLPRRCPVWLLAGSRDPVSLGKLGLGQLEIRYREAGLLDVRTTVYPGGRHEMLKRNQPGGSGAGHAALAGADKRAAGRRGFSLRACSQFFFSTLKPC
ncbi:alpha/beta hydrolase [Chromobacterium haemolyticum]|nr:alpha/beta hydrolase [Chromobacterium haemolyticum]